MILTFLGTGTSQGVPVIACGCEVCSSIDFHDKRLRTSVHIEADGVNLVIDTGPDFRQQMLRERIKRLDAVLYTHEHKDHTAGLDDIRSFNFRQQMDMPLYGAENVLAQIQQEYAYIFTDKKYPGLPMVELRPITNQPFFVNQLKVTPIQVMHSRLPVFGFRIGGLSYITDANYISEEEKEKLRGSKVLVLNALQIEAHASHFTLDQAIAIAQEIGAEKTYFTHISHKLGLHRNISPSLPRNIELAHDGLKVSL